MASSVSRARNVTWYLRQAGVSGVFRLVKNKLLGHKSTASSSTLRSTAHPVQPAAGSGDATIRVISGLAELRQLKGQEIGCSDWFKVDQELINAFGKLTGDEHWIHTDPERCRNESPFQTTIAHGALTLSLLTKLVQQTVEFRGELPRTMSYGFNRIRFPSPVITGSRIRLRVSLIDVQEIPGGAQMTWDIKVESENGSKPSLAAEWVSRTYY